jgi:hypothetical protein
MEVDKIAEPLLYLQNKSLPNKKPLQPWCQVAATLNLLDQELDMAYAFVKEYGKREQI